MFLFDGLVKIWLMIDVINTVVFFIIVIVVHVVVVIVVVDFRNLVWFKSGHH